MTKENIKYWIVPLKSERFNINKLESKKSISFQTIYHFDLEDYVYIYLTKPAKKIILKGKVFSKKTHFKTSKKDGKKKKVHQVQLKDLLIFPSSEEKLIYEQLLKNGLHGPIRVALNLEHNIPLKNFIFSVETSYRNIINGNLNFNKISIPDIFENFVKLKKDKLLFFSVLLLGTGVSAGLLYYLLKRRN